MKKIKMSLMAMLATSALVLAGGDIAPVEPEVNVPVEEVEAVNPLAGLYVGAGYGYGTAEAEVLGVTAEDNFDSIVLQAGYKFNEYIAAEARYWVDLESDGADTWAIYAKPMYSVTPEVGVYALLGYADVDTGDSTDGFSWGLGASYALNDNVSLFADYVNMYDDTINTVDMTVDTVNVGVTYSF